MPPSGAKVVGPLGCGDEVVGAACHTKKCLLAEEAWTCKIPSTVPIHFW